MIVCFFIYAVLSIRVHPLGIPLLPDLAGKLLGQVNVFSPDACEPVLVIQF